VVETLRYWLLEGDDVVGPFEAEALKRAPGFTPESLVRPARGDGTPVAGWQRAAAITALSPPSPFLPPSPTLRDLQVVGTLVEKAELLDAGLDRMDRELRSRDEEITDLKASLEDKERTLQELRSRIAELEGGVREAQGLREELQRVRIENSRQAELAQDLDGKFRDLHARIGTVEALRARVSDLQGEFETVRGEMRAAESAGSAPAAESASSPPLEAAGDAGSPGPFPPESVLVEGDDAAGMRASGASADEPPVSPPPPVAETEPDKLFKTPPGKPAKKRAWVGILKTTFGLLLSAAILGAAGYWAVQGRRKKAGKSGAVQSSKTVPVAAAGPKKPKASPRKPRPRNTVRKRPAARRPSSAPAGKSPARKRGRSVPKKSPPGKPSAKKPVKAVPKLGRGEALAFLREYPVRSAPGLLCPGTQEALLDDSRKTWAPPGTLGRAAACRPRLAVVEALEIVERSRSVGRKEALDIALADIKEGGGLPKLYPMKWEASSVREGVYRIEIEEKDELTQRFLDKYEPHLRKVLEAMGKKVVPKEFARRYEVDLKAGTVRPVNMLGWRELDAPGYDAWVSGGGKGPSGEDRVGLSRASAEGLAPAFRLAPGGVPAAVRTSARP